MPVNALPGILIVPETEGKLLTKPIVDLSEASN
jgi:hypothetical protein